MAVGADVLDGGGSGESGDFAEGFDASETSFAGIGDDVVPVFATHDFEFGTIRSGSFSDALHTVDDDCTTKTFVVANSVGAIAERYGGEVVLFGKTVGIRNFFGGFNFEDVASRATKAHGS